MQADGRTIEGDPILVIDSLGAGRGETVIITSDGIGARELVGDDALARPLVCVGNSRRMSKPTIDIDRVVREVLAELGAAPEAVRKGGDRGLGIGQEATVASSTNSRTPRHHLSRGDDGGGRRPIGVGAATGCVDGGGSHAGRSRRVARAEGIALEYGDSSDGRSAAAVRLGRDHRRARISIRRR